jgi:hypothetical protein
VEIKAECHLWQLSPILVLPLERGRSRGFCNAASEVVTSVPMAGWGCVDRDAACRNKRVSRSLLCPVTRPRSTEGRSTPTYTTSQRDSLHRPTSVQQGDIVHIIRLDQEDDGVVYYDVRSPIR